MSRRSPDGVLSSAARGTVDWSRLDNSAVHRHVTACAKT